MEKYKINFDNETKTWSVLKKEMIFIDKYSWVVFKTGFRTKEAARLATPK